MTICVLIADDHALVREGLRMTFYETEIELVVEAENGQAAFDQLQKHTEVDVALVDIQMPDADGFQFLRLVREAGLTTPVLMYSALSSDQSVEACRALGACGFVEKGCDRNVLLTAIRSAATGRMAWNDFGPLRKPRGISTDKDIEKTSEKPLP